ncbi:MAG: TM0106 family RecB-like putative nuclease [Chloroflexota bacterium]
MIVTLEDLIWLDRCPRRLWLDRHAGGAPRAEPTRDARARSEANRVHIERLVATSGAAAVPDGPWEERLAATAALVRAGAPLIAWAALEATAGELTLRAVAHLLRRTRDPAAPGGWAYCPIDIRLHGEPTRWDRTRIDALRWLAGAALGYPRPPDGELWLGADGAGPARVLHRRGDAAAVGQALAGRYDALLAGPAPPIWFDSNHCTFCPWHDACDRAALAELDLATLPGLRRTHVRALRARRITSVPQLARLRQGALADIPDSDEATERRLRANAEALVSGRAVRRGELADGVWPAVPPEERGQVLFLDVETDPLTREPWAVGWMDAGGAVGMAIVAPVARPKRVALEAVRVTLVRTAAQAWRAAAEVAGAAPAVVHWGDAESLLLARTAGREARAALGPRLRDLHAALTETVALPIPRLSTQRSAGLKPVAGWLGYRWPNGADHWGDGWEAYLAWRRTWRARQRGAPPPALARLGPAVAYLRSDLEALAAVWRWYVELVSGGGAVAGRDP